MSKTEPIETNRVSEDDGFESDGSFEEMLSQIPNQEFINAMNERHSELDTNVHNQSKAKTEVPTTEATNRHGLGGKSGKEFVIS